MNIKKELIPNSTINIITNPNLKKMARAMLDYTKTILNKVSFDTTLFCKEVQKAIERLLPYEIEELKIFIHSLVQQNPELNQCLIYLKP